MNHRQSWHTYGHDTLSVTTHCQWHCQSWHTGHNTQSPHTVSHDTLADMTHTGSHDTLRVTTLSVTTHWQSWHAVSPDTLTVTTHWMSWHTASQDTLSVLTYSHSRHTTSHDISSVTTQRQQQPAALLFRYIMAVRCGCFWTVWVVICDRCSLSSWQRHVWNQTSVPLPICSFILFAFSNRENTNNGQPVDWVWELGIRTATDHTGHWHKPVLWKLGIRTGKQISHVITRKGRKRPYRPLKQISQMFCFIVRPTKLNSLGHVRRAYCV